MMIRYNESNVLAIPHINELALKQLKSGVKGKTSKPVVQTPQDILWLRPGWNEFPRVVWEQNKSNPLIQKLLKKGKIELLEHRAKVKVKTTSGKTKTVEKLIGADDKPIKLKYFDEPLAAKIVKQTLNRDMLQRWLDEERRHRVKKALRKQIKPLLPSRSGDDEDDSFDDDQD